MNVNNKINILVVTHKVVKFPIEEIYFPICVGPYKNNFGANVLRDDQGENIANKNNQYSELTALYWAWKNLSSNYIGIVHYRRYMTKRNCRSLNNILSKEEALYELKHYDILAVKPRIYFETVKNHFINCHKTMKDVSARQIKILSDVIEKYTPEYKTSFDTVMNGHSAHMFNMFVMSYSDLNDYCSWIFPILFETEKIIKSEGILFDRLMGSLSEFLLDTWILKNNKTVENLKLYHTEMDLFQHIKRFIYRRFLEK